VTECIAIAIFLKLNKTARELLTVLEMLFQFSLPANGASQHNFQKLVAPFRNSVSSAAL